MSIRQVAIMRQAEIALAIMHIERLDIFELARSTGRRVAVMRDRGITGECIGQNFRVVKNAQDKAIVFMNLKLASLSISICYPIRSKNTGRFLTAMLQRMQRIVC